jgi:hypothetical protein
VARTSQRRAQGVLFSFLTVFFVGIAATAFQARAGLETWVIAVAAGVLALWMGGLAIRTFRAAREETAR